MRNAFWNKTIQQCGSRHHRRAGWEELVEDIIWETVRWYQQSKESVSEYKHSYVKKCLTFVSEHQQKQDCRTFFQKGKIPSQLASLLRGQTLTRMIGKMYQSRSAKLSWPANQPGLYLFGDTRPKKSCWTQPYFCRRLVDPGGLKCVSLTTNLYKWLHTGEWVWEGSQSTYMGWFFVLKPPKLYGNAWKHSTMGHHCALIPLCENFCCCRLIFWHVVTFFTYCAQRS